MSSTGGESGDGVPSSAAGNVPQTAAAAVSTAADAPAPAPPAAATSAGNSSSSSRISLTLPGRKKRKRRRLLPHHPAAAHAHSGGGGGGGGNSSDGGSSSGFSSDEYASDDNKNNNNSHNGSSINATGSSNNVAAGGANAGLGGTGIHVAAGAQHEHDPTGTLLTQAAAPALPSGGTSGISNSNNTAGDAASVASSTASSAASSASSATSTDQNRCQAKEIARDTIGVGETQCFQGMNPHEVVLVDGRAVKVSARPVVAASTAAAAAGAAAGTGTDSSSRAAAAGGTGAPSDEAGDGAGDNNAQSCTDQLPGSGNTSSTDDDGGGGETNTAGSVQEMMQRVAAQQLVARHNQHQNHHHHHHHHHHGGNSIEGTTNHNSSHSHDEGDLVLAGSSSSTEDSVDSDSNGSGSGSDQQPDGWRVKLYRLNPDGTWDDCGTGRIVCLIHGRHDGPPYKKKRRLSNGSGSGSGSGSDTESAASAGAEQQHAATATPAATATAAAGTATDPPTTLEGLYSHLGEPTLLMRAEINHHPHGQHHHHHHRHHTGQEGDADQPEYGDGANSASAAAAAAQQQHPSPTATVLLRTRVLLSGDAYQRQGENIITWSEPCFGDEGSESGASSSDAESASDTSDSEGESGGTGGGSSSGGGGSSSSPRVSPKSKSAEEGGISASSAADDDEPPPGVDLALSFQDNAGCLDIWSKITNVQARAVEIVNHNSHSGRPGAARGLLDPAGHHGDHHHRHGHHHHHRHGHHSHGHSGTQRSPLLDGMDADEHGHIDDKQHPSLLDHLADDDGETQSDDVVSKLDAAAAAARAEPGDIIDRDQEGGGQDLMSLGGAHGDHASALVSMAEMGDEVDGVSLPPPTADNLPNITTTLSTVPLPSQRESYAIFLSQNECAYLRNLLSLFNPAEQRGDFPTLATLAACVKTVLLLNDAAIIEPIIEFGPLFEDVCAALEYDPDLRTKARHRHFLRNCTKFRTVIQMDEREGGPDRELIEAIFRSFRVGYLRDTILRPTMDESSLSTLSSLGSFISTDVVRGVMVPPNEGIVGSYLSRVLKVLATEIIEVRKLEHQSAKGNGGVLPPLMRNTAPPAAQPPPGPWAQHLSPQDLSLASRRTRRSDCLRFLRELFSMVRENLQQSDRDDFFETMCIMEVPVGQDVDQTAEDTAQIESDADGIKLLSLLGCILSDPNVTISEKSAVLEIVSSIAVHDPCLVRRHCLEELQKDLPSRPTPDNNSAVIFVSRKPDLLLSLLSSLAVEVDAGLLLQVSEVLRIVLDTDMAHTDMVGGELNGFGASSGGGGLGHGDGGSGSSFLDDESGTGQGGGDNGDNFGNSSSSGQGGMIGMALDDSSDAPQGSVESAIKEENRFLSLFYEFYVAWLVAPFQYTVLIPSIAPLLTDSAQFASQQSEGEVVVMKSVPPCAVRASFAIEILSFCVRAHVYRMKFYVLRSRVLGTILGLLGPSPSINGSSKRPYSSPRSVDRCLKLSALRFLRAVLSVRDEFYHRHIIQQDLFKPVFDAFRENPVGDNLVSSAVIEMCDYIRIENIRSLVEYVATRHLGGGDDGVNGEKTGSRHRRQVSLEEVAAPHTDTLEQLRQKHEENLLTVGGGRNTGGRGQEGPMDENQPPRSRYFDDDDSSNSSSASGPVGGRVAMNERAREDQRKFRALEDEEAFFAEGDDDDEEDNHVDMRVIRPSGVASPPPPSGAVSSALPPALQQLQELESHRASSAAAAASSELGNEGMGRSTGDDRSLITPTPPSSDGKNQVASDAA